MVVKDKIYEIVAFTCVFQNLPRADSLKRMSSATATAT